MRSRLLLVSTVLLVAASACAEPGLPADLEPSPPAASETPVSTEPPGPPSALGDLRATCGPVRLGPPTDVSLPEEPVDPEIEAALREAEETLGVEGEFFGNHDWSVAERSSEHLVLFGRPHTEADPARPTYGFARFEREGERWEPAGWGGCRVEVDAPGWGNARWVTDPGHEPDPASGRLAVLINERACASGEPPVGREVLPVVDAREDRVIIVVLVEPVKGGATCPSNPWHPVTVELGEPLGNRPLYDASRIPPVLRPWPPTDESLEFFGEEE